MTNIESLNATNLTGDTWDRVEERYILKAHVSDTALYHYLDAREVWSSLKCMHESTSRPRNPYTQQPLSCDLLMATLDAIDLTDRNNYLLAECLETLCLLHPTVFLAYTGRLLGLGVCTRLTHTCIERLIEIDNNMALRYAQLADYESAWLADIHMLGGYSTVVAMLQIDMPFGLGATHTESVCAMLKDNGLPYSRAAADFVVNKATLGTMSTCLTCLLTTPHMLSDSPLNSETDSSDSDSQHTSEIIQFAHELIRSFDTHLDDANVVEKVEAYLQERQFTYDTFAHAFAKYIELRNPLPMWLLNRSLGVPHPVLSAFNTLLATQLLQPSHTGSSYMCEAFVFGTTQMPRIPFVIEAYAHLDASDRADPACVLNMVRNILK